MTYLLGLIWGFVLLAVFAGWGLALDGLLRGAADNRQVDWGGAIVLGMAAVVAFCGFLNLAGVLGRATIWLLLIAGLALLAALVGRPNFGVGGRRALAGPRNALDAIVLAVCLVVYGCCICLSESPYGDIDLRQRFTLNPWDDLHGGYVVGPIRLLDEGRLGEDPFNSPRSLALGGLAVLQAFALLVLPVTYIHLIDPGLAVLVLPLVLRGISQRRGWPHWLAPALTLVGLTLKFHWVNATVQLLPTILLLSLYHALDGLAQEPRARMSALFSVALLAATLMTLKNTLVPGTCLILGLVLVLDYAAWRKPRRTLTCGLAATGMLGLLLVPWLVASNRASGTPLYPLLGRGYWANSVIETPALAPRRGLASEARELARPLRDPRMVLLLGVGALGTAASRRLVCRQRGVLVYPAFLLGSLTLIFLYAHIFPTGDWLRYSYNFLVSSLLASFALLLGSGEGRGWLRGLSPGAPVLLASVLVAVIVAGGAYQVRFLQRTAEMVAKAATGRGWDPDAERPDYQRLQSAIPPGSRFLAFVPMAHLLEFGRNPMNVVHLSCGTSPPPGLPLRRRPVEVARYLRSLGISWVAAVDTCQLPTRRSRDPEDIYRWSEAASDDVWSASTIFSYYLMARAVRSLSEMYESTRFGSDLVLIDLDRPSASFE